MKIKLFILGIFFTTTFCSFGQKAIKDVVYEDFIKQITITKANNDHVRLSMWLPEIFWDIAASKSKDLTPGIVTEIKDAMGEYAIFCVVDANLTDPMAVVTSSDDQIRKTLSIDFNGKNYKPVAESELSEIAVIMKTNFEPMFASMMGNFGSGMKMYFFHINDRNGDPLLNPYGETSFVLSLTGTKLNYHLPIAALLDDKICPVDKEALQGDYKFCPYHGAELK